MDADRTDRMSPTERREERMLESAYLPGETPTLSEVEGVRIAAEVTRVLARFAGRRAAPLSALPVGPEIAAEALGHARDAGADDRPLREELRRTRAWERAVMDLQGFVPDEEAALVEALDDRVGAASDVVDEEARRRADAVLEGVRVRQAAVAALIRDDPTVVGNVNALRGVDVRIGHAADSFRAIDLYRESQASAIGSMLAWGILTPAAAAVSSILGGWRISAVVAAMAVAVLGVVVGWAWGAGVVGPLSAAISHRKRLATEVGQVVAWDVIAVLVGLLLLVGTPVAVGVLLVVAATRLGLP